MVCARRIATVVTAAAVLAAPAAGCGGDGDGSAPLPRADAPPESVPALRPLDYDRIDRARREADEAAWRRDQLRRLEGHRSVPAALRRALLRQVIGKNRHDAYLAAYRGARKAVRRLDGARRAEQATVVASVETLAANGQLVAGRMPAVFLNLRRNTRTWTTAPFPSAGERRTFGRSPAVFQYVPGRGMQLHQLATWGVVNARLRVCLRSPRPVPAQAAGPAARRARAAGRPARRLPRVGVLLPLRAGLAAVDQRDGPGHGRAGALPRRARARQAALPPRGPPRARRVHHGAAARRGRAVRGRLALRHVLLRAVAADPQRRAAGHQRAARRRRLRPQRRSPPAWSGPATARRARRSAASTPAPGRCTPRPARSPRSPTTSSPRTSSSTSAGGPTAPSTATRRRASRATSASRRGSGSPRCATSGPGGRRRCGSRSPRAPRCRCGSTARAASSCRATSTSTAGSTTSAGSRPRAGASTCGCAPAGRRAGSASRTGRSRSRSRSPSPSSQAEARAGGAAQEGAEAGAGRARDGPRGRRPGGRDRLGARGRPRGGNPRPRNVARRAVRAARSTLCRQGRRNVAAAKGRAWPRDVVRIRVDGEVRTPVDRPRAASRATGGFDLPPHPAAVRTRPERPVRLAPARRS